MSEPAPTNDIRWVMSDAQANFFQDDSHFACLYVGGWGSGKTWVGGRKGACRAVENPNSLGLISANTHEQLQQSTLVEFWNTLERDFGFTDGVDYVYNRRPPAAWGVQDRVKKHNNVITFRWGTQVVTRSLERYKPILGMTLDWAWIDETADARRDAFRAVLSRLRGKNIPAPRLDLTGSPDGFNWLWQYFEDEPATEPKLRAQRAYYIGSTYDNRANLPADYIENLLSSMDGQAAKQFVYGQWVDLFTGQAYSPFSREANLSELAVFTKHLPVYLCCDFNVDPMSWVVVQPWDGRKLAGIDHGRKIKFQDKCLVVVDEITLRTSNTQEAIDEFKSRGYGENPHLVTVFGDATGQRSTTVSDFAIIQQAGFKDIRVPAANPYVPDRIAATNAKFINAKGEVGIIANPRKCPELIRDWTQVGYKPGTRQLNKTDLARTHHSDAFDYMVYQLFPVHRPKPKVQVRRY